MASPLVIPAIFRAIDQITGPMRGMSRGVTSFTDKAIADSIRLTEKLKANADRAKSFAMTTGAIGTAILAPLAIAAKQAVTFEDKMADIAKTSGLTGQALDGLGKDILSMSLRTRTSIEDLQKIAEIGGAKGITSREGLRSFTEEVNKFNVALGSDFGGGVEEASRAIGGLNLLFKETRSLDIAESITRSGSAINALAAKGVRAPELTEFISRIGQLPDAIKPSIQATAALGAVFDKAGITAEISSRAVGDVLITAAKNIPAYAKQMKLSAATTKELLNTDPGAFLEKFSATLKGLNSTDFVKIADKLKISDNGSLKVVGTLSSATEQLAQFQAIANGEFAKGTSLLNEYNTKNETTAAALDKAKNNAQALAITIGTKLLPIINKIIKRVAPLIEGVIAWADNNPVLAETLVVAAAAMGVAFIALSLLATAIWAVNVALYANPIGLVVAALIILGIELALVIHYWDEWGKYLILLAGPLGVVANIIVNAARDTEGWGRAFLTLIGPIGWVVQLLVMLYRHWDKFKKAWDDKGFFGVIKELGKMLLDFVLFPIQLILQGLSHLPGAIGRAAASGAASLQQFREGLGVSDAVAQGDLTRQQVADRYERDGVAYPSRVVPGMNPKAENNDATIQKILAITKGSQEIIVRAAPGTEAEKGKSTGNGTGVKIESTMTPR